MFIDDEVVNALRKAFHILGSRMHGGKGKDAVTPRCESYLSTARNPMYAYDYRIKRLPYPGSSCSRVRTSFAKFQAMPADAKKERDQDCEMTEPLYFELECVGI